MSNEDLIQKWDDEINCMKPQLVRYLVEGHEDYYKEEWDDLKARILEDNLKFNGIYRMHNRDIRRRVSAKLVVGSDVRIGSSVTTEQTPYSPTPLVKEVDAIQLVQSTFQIDNNQGQKLITKLNIIKPMHIGDVIDENTWNNIAYEPLTQFEEISYIGIVDTYNGYFNYDFVERLSKKHNNNLMKKMVDNLVFNTPDCFESYATFAYILYEKYIMRSGTDWYTWNPKTLLWCQCEPDDICLGLGYCCRFFLLDKFEAHRKYLFNVQKKAETSSATADDRSR